MSDENRSTDQDVAASAPVAGEALVAAVETKVPLSHDEYLKQRESIVAAYISSINEYDRLVTWASAGALGLSISFLEKFGTNADRSTAWILAAGWGLLSGAFAFSLWSQYFSSRLHSWKRRELDHCQLPLNERSESWTGKAARLQIIGRLYGIGTRWLTFISGVALVGGIVTIASFAFLNAPFKDAGSGVSQATTGPTDKKGLDYTPPPVPRPTTATTTTVPAPSPTTDQKP